MNKRHRNIAAGTLATAIVAAVSAFAAGSDAGSMLTFARGSSLHAVGAPSAPAAGPGRKMMPASGLRRHRPVTTVSSSSTRTAPSPRATRRRC